VSETAPSESIVFLVDDDPSVRASVKELLESVGLKVIAYGSAAAFLESAIPDSPSCMVLDVRLPEMSGLKLQEELTKAEIQVPIVFVSGHGDIAMAVRAMKAGAVDFLIKPFSTQDLLDAVYAALGRPTRTGGFAIHVARTFRLTERPRERSALACGVGAIEQADRSGSRDQRSYGEGASGERYAKDARKVRR